jgi:hypothetical protein
MTTHQDTAAQAEALLQSTGDIAHDASAGALDAHPLAQAVQQAALTSDVGTIAFAGQYASGSYAVQFNNSAGAGYSSVWPAWAYEIARTALASNKRVWVAANGDPFGANLVFVMLYAY